MPPIPRVAMLCPSIPQGLLAHRSNVPISSTRQILEAYVTISVAGLLCQKSEDQSTQGRNCTYCIRTLVADGIVQVRNRVHTIANLLLHTQ
jgi:hypothetical protein